MNVLQAILFGLVSGLVGTIALTISETLEIKATKRKPSMVPGQVGARLFGLHPAGDAEMEKLSTKVHWGHGIVMGAVLGLLSLLNLSFVPLFVLFYVLFWSGDALLYKSLGIADFPWKWQGTALITDLFHKGVYSLTATVAIYNFIRLLNT